jgi:hypothetical protein
LKNTCTVGAIGAGLLVLLCAERGDTEAQADKLLAKLLKLRIFSDEAGKMNRSVQDTGGGLLVVSQFTLAADTSAATGPASPMPRRPTRAAPVRLLRRAGAGRAPAGADRRVRRRHAGAPGERRAGDHPDADDGVIHAAGRPRARVVA